MCRERHTQRKKKRFTDTRKIVKRSPNVNSGSFLSRSWDYRGFLFHILLHVLSGIFHLLCGEHILLLKPKENNNVISEREKTSSGWGEEQSLPKLQRSSETVDHMRTHILHTRLHTHGLTHRSTFTCTAPNRHTHKPIFYAHSVNNQSEIPEVSKEGKGWRRGGRRGSQGSPEMDGRTDTHTHTHTHTCTHDPLAQDMTQCGH